MTCSAVLAVGLAFSLGMAACRPSGSPASQPGTVDVALTPYWTLTPSPVPPAAIADNDPERTPSATIPPPPTATPFTYEVKKGDTLLAIAIRHGVTLDDLQAANPDVDPRILSVGTRLVIPLDKKGGTPEVLPSPTPLPVRIDTPRCYPAGDGGLWCLAPVHNDQSQAVENLSAWISLSASNGEVVTGTMAIPPLNLIPSGKKLPLMAYFPASKAIDSLGQPIPQVELVTAFPVAGDGGRYLPLNVQISQETIAPSGLQATIKGRVDYPKDATLVSASTVMPDPTAAVTPTEQADAITQPPPAAGTVWVAVVAYGSQGEVVGVRKWEAAKAIPPGKHRDFEVTVYSLGPAIERVELLVEARP